MNRKQETALQNFCNAVLSKESDNLIQIALSNEHSQDNDQGLCIILESDSTAFVKQCNGIIKPILKASLPVPYVFTRSYIEQSLDSYPLEFLNMKLNYNSLYEKEDFLKSLVIEKTDLRLQLERDTKGRFVNIQRHLLANYNKLLPRLYQLLRMSMVSLKPVFAGVLYYVDKPVPLSLTAILNEMESSLSLLLPAMHKTNDIMTKKSKLVRAESIGLVEDFLHELNDLIITIEHWQ